MFRTLFILIALIATPMAHAAPVDDPRPLNLTLDGIWIGAGISYGEYRDGQSPEGDAPTDADLREDLHIIARHWNLLRMYGTRNVERTCRIIREDKLPIRVMAGAWLTTESADEQVQANRSEVTQVIRVANAFPDVVIAINVGNETQVYWSGHRVEQQTLIRYIREVRDGTEVPVTTCDDYAFWNKPESRAVAAECDFLGLHAYAMWNKQPLANALTWTRQQITEVQSVHPDLTIVHCETGWATSRLQTGEQAELMKGVAGEKQQELFYRAYRSWAEETHQAHFYFVAFDENWKGGNHPAEAEKHWGLYNADRTPKQAISGRNASVDTQGES